MSSVSSIAGFSSSGISQLFQSFAANSNSIDDADSTSSSTAQTTSSGSPDPAALFTDALRAQGLSDDQIASLQAKIQTAVQTALQNSSSIASTTSTGSSASSSSASDTQSTVQSAIDQTLEANGVDPAKVQSYLKASSPDGPPPPPPSSSSNSDIDAYLKSKGINPTDLRKSLFDSASNSSSGSVDFAQLFGNLSTGSTLDVSA